MSTRNKRAERGGINPFDVYYILFRHKWKILFLSLAGIAGAALVYLYMPRMYESQASLAVRYVVENRNLISEGESDVRSPDRRGDNIINTEIDILTSLDLALEVVRILGAAEVLAAAGGGDNPYAAAALLKSNLKVEAPRRSNVIRVRLSHPSPEIARQALATLIEEYKLKHLKIHRSWGMHNVFLHDQITELGNRLARTEDALRQLQATNRVISVADAKATATSLISQMRQELLVAETELLEKEASLRVVQNRTNGAEGLADQNAAELSKAPDPQKLAVYSQLVSLLDDYRREEIKTLAAFKEESAWVKAIRKTIAETERRKLELEQEDPRIILAGVRAAGDKTSSINIVGEVARIAGLHARVGSLRAHLENLQAEAVKLNEVETQYNRLLRQKTQEEEQLRRYSTTLEQARIDEEMGPGKVSNLGDIQAASPAAGNSRTIYKYMAALLAGGLLSGLGLAFFSEKILDQRVKRPMEIELSVPLFLSIPVFKRHKRLKLGGSSRKALPAAVAAGSAGGESPSPTPLIPAEWKADSELQIYYETLRDRVIGYFEAKGMTHKPKLVAITSCGRGAGVTTIAAGLAAALSETGDGNVLLVDMNMMNGTQFSKNTDPESGRKLEDLLEEPDRSDALVGENLYLARGTGNNGKYPRVLPKRFLHLMPKLKASDYDYIIFDMPPIGQTSITPRLTSFMDMNILVIESERTLHQTAERAAALLLESNENTVAVLNKYRKYVPGALHPEF